MVKFSPVEPFWPTLHTAHVYMYVLEYVLQTVRWKNVYAGWFQDFSKHLYTLNESNALDCQEMPDGVANCKFLCTNLKATSLKFHIM